MKIAKKIWGVFTTVLVAAAVIAAVSLVGVRLLGFKVFTVLSGSMEPTYHTGSVIYVKPVDYRELKVGDAISFMLDEDTVATHRIIEIVPDEEDPDTLRYRTKGDANEAEDGGLVHYKNVIGKPVFSVPLLGFFVNYIQHPPGTYIAIAGGAFLILLLFLPELLGMIFSDEDAEPEPEKKPKEKKQKPAKEQRPPKKHTQPERRPLEKPAAYEEPAEGAAPEQQTIFDLCADNTDTEYVEPCYKEPVPEEPAVAVPAEKPYIEYEEPCYEEPEPEYVLHRATKHEAKAPEKRAAKPKKQKYVPKH